MFAVVFFFTVVVTLSLSLLVVVVTLEVNLKATPAGTGNHPAAHTIDTKMKGGLPGEADWERRGQSMM